MGKATRRRRDRPLASRRWLAAAALGLLAGAASASGDGAGAPPVMVAGAIVTPLTGKSPDVARGRAVLDGVGARLGPAQLRARLVDSTRLDADSVMPAYHRIEGLARVAPPYRGRPVLSALEVEDLVAFLSSLQGS